MPQGWDLGCWGGGEVKNFSVGICDGAPSTARSSYYLKSRCVWSILVEDIDFHVGLWPRAQVLRNFNPSATVKNLYI